MKVVVEAHHIAAGYPCMEEACPITLAIMDALKGEPVVSVFTGSEVVTVVFEDGREKTFLLAWEITEIIDEFDSTGIMYPFGFEL